MPDATSSADLYDDHRARANVIKLGIAQALSGANAAVIFATGAIVGSILAPDVSLATVPVSIYVVGLAVGTLPTGTIARLYGRRVAFIIGSGCGALCGLLGMIAILYASFTLFCIATFFGGLYGAVAQSYRFAAADGASVAYRPKAVSWVMAGGVFAGVLGPQLVQWTMDIWQPYLFAFSFLMQAVIALVAMALLSRVNAPKPPPASQAGGRPLLQIVRQPVFIAAAVCGVVSYAMMNLVMTSAPLAMRMCGLPLSDSNFGLQWHIVAMYGPSFFTGSLIARFGAPAVIALGLALEAVAAIIGLSGETSMHFWAGLDRARTWLEFRLHRCIRHGAGNPSSGGAHQGAVIQRLHCLWPDGGGLVPVRADSRQLWLGHGQHRGVPAGHSRPHRARLCRHSEAAGAHGAGRTAQRLARSVSSRD